MTKKNRVDCISCGARHILDEEHEGRMGRCSQCDERFILPIRNPDKLLEWAQSTTWQNLIRFIDHSGARGHERAVVDKLTSILEKRRWAEEHKTYREASPTGRSLTRRQKIWERSERRIRRAKTLDELRKIEQREFEKLVAQVFESKDMIARAVGGQSDGGIDIKIWDSNGVLWAVAQCKRYPSDKRVSASQIREFAGAYLLSGAERGFYFTTSDFTRNAKRTASGYPWLKLFNGADVIKYLKSVLEGLSSSTKKA